MLSSFWIVIYDFFFYLETFCKMWKNSKEIEERISEGVLAIPLEKKTEALPWKLPVELFISRTFPASLCFNCVLKISPERQSTTCPEACPSDRETKKYRFLGYGFQKIHIQASIKITGFVSGPLQQESGFTELLAFQSQL